MSSPIAVIDTNTASRVYSDSTNTIRIVTMIDVDRGMPFIRRGRAKAVDGRGDKWHPAIDVNHGHDANRIRRFGVNAGCVLRAGRCDR